MTLKVKVNRKAIRDILRSSEIQADLTRRANNVATAAGPGHDVESDVGRNRARAAVITETAAAKRAEATSRNLTRSIDAARR